MPYKFFPGNTNDVASGQCNSRRVGKAIIVKIVSIVNGNIMKDYIARLRTTLSKRWGAILCLFLVCLLTYASLLKINGQDIKSDPKFNALVGYHLWNDGVFSLDGKTLTYFREPLPAVVTALHIGLFTSLGKGISNEDLVNHTSYTKQIGQVNLIYVPLGLVSIYWLSIIMTGSRIIGLTSIICVWLLFYSRHYFLNMPNGESLAVVLLTMVSVTSVLLVKKRTKTRAVFAGIVFGLFALTKASGLYIAIVAIPLLAASLVVFNLERSRRAALIFFITILAFLFSVMPWMIRNQVNFGDLAIAQRGGSVLLIRATKNQMTDEEYRGAFYVYSPTWLKRYFFESYLNYAPESLCEGGKYEALIREKHRVGGGHEKEDARYCITLRMNGDLVNHKKGKASYLSEYFKHRVELMENQKVVSGKQSLGKLQLMTASRMIQENYGKHLLMSAPFSWRGIWSYPGHTHFSTVAANLVGFGVFLALPFIGIWKRRADLFAFSIFGSGMFWFFALLTHFIPRYSTPLIPVTVLSGMMLLQSLVMVVLQKVDTSNTI